MKKEHEDETRMDGSACLDGPRATASPDRGDVSGSSHTPGPWEWFTRRETRLGEMCMKYLKGSDGQGFAHTVGLHEPCDTANANLIAAAPDLLAALKALVEASRQHDEWVELRYRQDNAVDAIKKAEGRA